MSRSLIITAAGTSSRFSSSVGYEVLKCVYCEAPRDKTILGDLLDMSQGLYDSVIVVGGYRYSDIEAFLEARNDLTTRLVMNEHYRDWGSNYSLFLGLVEALRSVYCEEIVFAEGDLVVDRNSFERIALSQTNVVSYTSESIQAEKSVAFYQSLKGEIKYIYDTQHRSLAIDEPFTMIANSAQVWKFIRVERLREILSLQTEADFKDTNLNLVQRYFQTLSSAEYELIGFNKWYNCNTIDDYRRAFDVTTKS